MQNVAFLVSMENLLLVDIKTMSHLLPVVTVNHRRTIWRNPLIGEDVVSIIHSPKMWVFPLKRALSNLLANSKPLPRFGGDAGGEADTFGRFLQSCGLLLVLLLWLGSWSSASPPSWLSSEVHFLWDLLSKGFP